MLIRFVTFKSMPDKVEELREFFNAKIFPSLRATEGCLFASLVEDTASPEEFGSLTLWDSAEDIRAYEDSGRFTALTEAARPFLAESDEWRLQLSDDMTLEYKPVVEEPRADAYRLYAVMDEEALRKGRREDMHLRLLRVQLREGGFEAFVQSYVETSIPALRDVKGCRNAFLIANPETQNQVISVTVWDSREDAEVYDRGPVFRALIDEAKDLLSAHVWQTTLKSDVGSRVYAGDEPQSRTYAVLAGERFPED